MVGMGVKFVRKTHAFTLVGLLASALLIGYGATEGQVGDTRCYSSVLCTSCLGIHEIAPEITFQEKAELTKVQNPVDLMLFTARGCLDCPKAHDFIESICQVTGGKVSYVEMDIVENQELIDKYGIEYAPSVIVGSRKLEGLGAIRNQLIPAIIEASGGQS